MELFTLGWVRGTPPNSHFTGLRFLFTIFKKWFNLQENLLYNTSCLISSLDEAHLISNYSKNVKITGSATAQLLKKMQYNSSFENKGGRGLIMGKVTMREKDTITENMVNNQNIIGCLNGTMANENNSNSEYYVYSLLNEHLDGTVAGTCERIHKMLKLPRKTDKMSGIFINKNIGHGLFGFIKDGPPLKLVTLNDWNAFIIVQSDVPEIIQKIRYQGVTSTIEFKNKTGFYIDLDLGEMIIIN